MSEIDKALEQLTLQIEALKKKADDTIPAVQPLITHKNTWECHTMPVKTIFSRSQGWGKWDEFTKANEFQMKLLTAMQSFKLAMDAHKLQENINKEAIENNKLVIAKVTSIMRFIGIPSTYTTSVYKTSRSRNPTKTTHTAGWLEDIRRSVPTSDNWEAVKREMESKMREIELYAKQKITELAAIEKEVDRVAAEKALVNYSTTLKIKYNLSYELDANEVLERLGMGFEDEHYDEEHQKLKELLDTYKALS